MDFYVLSKIMGDSPLKHNRFEEDHLHVLEKLNNT